jgi:thymidylate synthase (FAD)
VSYTLRTSVGVKLIQHMGSDGMIVAAAKVSTKGAESEECLDEKANAGLINFLMRNRHGTPFEHGAMTFLIEAPIFVFREFHRHRVGWSYNEESGRYKKLNPVFYVPDVYRPLVQVGKPGHYTFVRGSEEQHRQVEGAIERQARTAYAEYEAMLDDGIAKEIARSVLPVNTFSSMYATCNPRSLMHFLSLRTKRDEPWEPTARGPGVPEVPTEETFPAAKFPSFPQREIEMVAEKMEDEFMWKFPSTYEAYCRNGRVAP